MRAAVEVISRGPLYAFPLGSFHALLVHGTREGAEAWQCVSAADLCSAGVIVGPAARQPVPAFGKLTGRMDRLGGTEFSGSDAAAVLPALLQRSIEGSAVPPPQPSLLTLQVLEAAQHVHAVAEQQGLLAAAAAAAQARTSLPPEVSAAATPPPDTLAAALAVLPVAESLPHCGAWLPCLFSLLRLDLSAAVVGPRISACTLAAALLCRAAIPDGTPQVQHAPIVRAADGLTGAQSSKIKLVLDKSWLAHAVSGLPESARQLLAAALPAPPQASHAAVALLPHSQGREL